VLPRTKGIGIQPTPQGSAVDLSHQALRHHLRLDIGDGESRERESQTMRKFTGEGLYLNDDAGGKRVRDAPPRGCSSRPGRRAKANRLRHLLTICRRVSKRAAMTSILYVIVVMLLSTIWGAEAALDVIVPPTVRCQNLFDLVAEVAFHFQDEARQSSSLCRRPIRQVPQTGTCNRLSCLFPPHQSTDGECVAN
jgi:hypothetical protein